MSKPPSTCRSNYKVPGQRAGGQEQSSLFSNSPKTLAYGTTSGEDHNDQENQGRAHREGSGPVFFAFSVVSGPPGRMDGSLRVSGTGSPDSGTPGNSSSGGPSRPSRPTTG